MKIIWQFGGDPGDLAELRVLNGVFRWSKTGIFLEADPRHQEISVAKKQGKPIFIPGIKEQLLSSAAEQRPTDAVTSVFRSDAARINYSGLDRVDIA